MAGRLWLGAVLAASSANWCVAQTSELYLADYESTNVFVVQNGQIVRQFNRSSSTDGPAMAVQSTIKFIGVRGGATGREYDLDGGPLSGRYLNPQYEDFLDGASDGVRTWAIAHNDFPTNFALVEGDADWGNLHISFVPPRRSSGVTYDANSNTLWITNNVGGVDRVQQFDFAGNLISEFPASHSGGGYGIAWDPADDTLWMPGSYQTARQLFQYSKEGSLLQTVTVNGLTEKVHGAEFGPAGGRLTLTLSGDCPGAVTATAGNATSGNRIYFIHGFQQGTGPLVPGCPELRVDIVNPRITGSDIANANGEASISGNVPAAGCGRVFIQAVDNTDCVVSNIEGI